jgi:uncharacterized protein YkwD
MKLSLPTICLRMQKYLLITISCLLFAGITAIYNPVTAEETPEPPLVNPENQPTTQSDPSAPNYVGCGGVTVPPVDVAFEARVVELVNEVRASQGLAPLKLSPAIIEAARYHAADMGLDNYMDHDTFDRVGDNLTEVCGVWARIATYFSGATGENAAAGYYTPEAVMNAWMNSPGHQANILNPNSWEIGVGYFDGSGDYGAYWVQDFAKRPGIYPLIISGESASTSSRYVILHAYGDWDKIRVKNDAGAWTGWMPFSGGFAWILNQGKGVHTVSVEFNDGSQTVSSSDTIYLDNNKAALNLTNLPVVQWRND